MTLQEQIGDRQTLPVAEAARFLGLAERTLYNAIERGEVPNAGIGRAKRVPAWFVLQKLMPPTC